MSLQKKCLIVCLVFEGLLAFIAPSLCVEQSPRTEKRSVTVSDVIRMTRVAGPLDAIGYTGVGPKTGFASFAPNGKLFTIVVSKGNIENNTNDSSLLLFRISESIHAPVPRTLVVFSSSTNHEAISDVSWLGDNDSIFFLGAQGNETTQLYSIRCSTGEMKKLTKHPTSLSSYAVSTKGDTIVFSAEGQKKDVVNEDVSRHGRNITTELLSDLIRGTISNYEERELFLKGENGSVHDKRLRTQDPFDSGINDLFLSPDGRHLIVKTDTTELPASWSKYEDVSIRTVFRRNLPKGSASRLLRYELIDTGTGASEILLDSPTTYSSSDVLWSFDSKSILLCGTYLPLNVEDPAEVQARLTTRFVVEIDLPTRAVTKITDEDLSPVRWDFRTNTVQFHVLRNQRQTNADVEVAYYKKNGKVWQRVEVPGAPNEIRPDIYIEQDLNVPPRIVLVDPTTNHKVALLELNPEFGELRFGRVEEIQLPDTAGSRVSGGLYLPPDYSKGERYPLVIQTHGYDPHAFWIDGPHTTAFAAQPLASRGIVVLQVQDIFYDSLNTPREAERVMHLYENVIDYLDRKGIIDPSRVGLIGFSRTCFYVKYALTHSSRHFAAAIASDGFDGGYLQYLIFSNSIPIRTASIETVIGASPFGNGISAWLKESPGFMLDRVQTPLQIQALSPASLLGEWEWFSGLKRLHKPVELLYLPAGDHILVKPWERQASQEGSVDWLCFWLKGEEDPNPDKAEEYGRWRKLRAEAGNLAAPK